MCRYSHNRHFVKLYQLPGPKFNVEDQLKYFDNNNNNNKMS